MQHTAVGWGQPTEAQIHGGGLAQGGDICQTYSCNSKAEMCTVPFHGHHSPVLSSGARGANKRDTVPASWSISLVGPVKDSQLDVTSAAKHRSCSSQLGVHWGYEISKPQGGLPPLGEACKESRLHRLGLKPLYCLVLCPQAGL